MVSFGIKAGCGGTYLSMIPALRGLSQEDSMPRARLNCMQALLPARPSHGPLYLNYFMQAWNPSCSLGLSLCSPTSAFKCWDYRCPHTASLIVLTKYQNARLVLPMCQWVKYARPSYLPSMSALHVSLQLVMWWLCRSHT